MHFQNTWFIKIYKYIINFCGFFFIFILLYHHWTSYMYLLKLSAHYYPPYISWLIQTLVRFIDENIMSVSLTSWFTGSDFVSFEGKLLVFTKKRVKVKKTWKTRTIRPYIHNFCLNSLRIIIKSPLSKITEGCTS